MYCQRVPLCNEYIKGSTGVLGTHPDEIPWICYIDGCTMRFTHPGFLWKHQRSVHFAVGDDGQLVAKKVCDVEKPFECGHEGCGYAGT